MQFITSVMGGDGTARLTMIFALAIILFIGVGAVSLLVWFANWIRGGAHLVAWQSLDAYALPLMILGQPQTLKVRDIEVRNIGNKRAAGLIINLTGEPQLVYSNTSLEKITGVGAGYLLKAPYLDRNKPLILRVGALDGEPSEVSKVVADNVLGRRVDFSKERFKWGVLGLALVCTALAYLLGAASNPF